MHISTIKYKNNLPLFCFILSLITFSSVLVVGITAIYITNISELYNVSPGGDSRSWEMRFLHPVVIAPLWESFAFQLLPIYLLKKITTNNYIILTACTLLFSLLHLSNSELNAIQNIFTGFVFTYAFLYWQKKTSSYRKGFEATMIVHTLHNFYQFLLSFVPASLLF